VVPVTGTAVRWNPGRHRSAPYRAARARLRAAQKSGAGEPAYLRWVNRPLGARVAAVGYLLGATPNQVTTISGVLTLAGLAAVVVDGTNPVFAASATVLLLAGFVLDSADGQLARLRGTGNVAGEWLDHVVDAVRLPLAHLAIVICLWRVEAPPWTLAMCLAFSITASVWFFAATLGGKLDVAGTGRSTARAWVSFAKIPYDTSALFFLILALPWLPVFLTGYGILFVLTVAAAAVALRRKFRTLGRLATT